MKRLMLSVVLSGALCGCGSSAPPSPPVVTPPPAGKSVDVQAPGVDVKVDKDGVDVKAPGVEVHTDKK